MKNYIRLILLFTCFTTFGQNITIDQSTPTTSCANQNIAVNFTPLNGANGPYTVELIEKDYKTSFYNIGSCNNTNYSTKVSLTTSSNSVNLTIPQNLNTSFDPNYLCYANQYQYFTAYRYVDYYIKVTGSNAVSTDFWINLSSTCTPTLNPSIAPSPICAGKNADVKWNSIGANNGNIYTIELSNQFGSFSSPTVLATVSGNNSDGLKTQNVTIPSGSAGGSSYKIKVKSSDPVSEKEYGFTIKEASVCGPIQAVAITTTVCSGSTETVSWVNDGTFGSGNVFTVELDQNYNFTSPTTIGTVTSQTTTSASVTIPSSSPYGSYYVRVKASDANGSPYIGPNSSSFEIGLSQPSISGSSNACENSIFNLSIYSPQPESDYTFTWKKDNVSVNAQNQANNTSTYQEFFQRNIAQAADAGSYTITIVRNSDGCSTESNPLVVSVNTAPNPPTTSPVTVINGNTASLTASGCSGDIYWYNSLTADNNYNIGYGTYTTPELTQQTTYYAACRQNSGAYCYSTRTPLVVSIDVSNAPNAPILTASDNNFCQNSVQNPKLTASGCSGIVRWYYKYSQTSNYNMSETDTEAPYEYYISNYETRYYAADCRVNGVLSTTKSEITITVKPVPYTPDVYPSGGSVNTGSTVSLTASNCSGTVKWYADNTTTDVLATGNTYTTPTLINTDPNNTEYYYIYYTCTVNGCESSRNNRTFYIYNSIQAPNYSYQNNTSSVCSGNAHTITAHGCSNGTINWYDAYTNGNLLGSGATFTTPTLTYNSSGNNSYYYYADCTIGANTSSRNSANIYVNKQPTTPSANQPTIACGATATLTATGCNTNSPDYFSVYWYANTTTTSYIQSGSTFTTPNLSATTTYYVECQYSNCKSVRVPITVTAACTPPDAPIIASNLTTVCAGSGINLSATGCTGTVNWSDGGSGTSRTNVIFNASISLSATCIIGSLSSGTSNVLSITVNPKPVLVITNPGAVSPPNTINITLSALTVGSTLPPTTSLSYFTDANATITLNNPSAVANSGTYYIKATTNNGCFDIKPVVVVINNCSTPIVLVSTTDDYNTGTQLKKTNETITATNMITATAQATYRSNKSVLLNAGFKAQPTTGGYFKAEIGGCE